MMDQLLIGSALVIISVGISALIFLALEATMARYEGWLVKPPHRPKLVLVLTGTLLTALAMITANVWVWALAYRGLGIFRSLEEAVYFSLVSFTTLGFGDIILPREWRILSGMTAANGFLSIGMVSAVILETIRQVRHNQLGQR